MNKVPAAITAYRIIRTGIYLLKSAGIFSGGIDLAAYYLTGRLFPEFTDEMHLDAAMKWLCLAQNVCGGKGISAFYDFNKGWAVAYPETSGYIIGTYLAYAKLAGDDSYRTRALKVGDWEIEIQARNGGVVSTPLVKYTRVFNTGQVMLGWCALFEQTRDKKYIDAALRAVQYLIALQEENGSWVRDTYCGARTYHARTDCALLRLAHLSGEKRFVFTAKRNLNWILSQQRTNGWFDMCGFNNDDPITHVIDYTLKGLFECHLMGIPEIVEMDILKAVMTAADAICNAVKNYPVRGIDGMVPTSFDENWKSSDRHSCLTGNAQLSGLFLRLYQITGNEEYKTVSEKILKVTKKTQIINTAFIPSLGAIGGSYPFYEGYHAVTYPNWGTKFFADALIMKISGSDVYIQT